MEKDAEKFIGSPGDWKSIPAGDDASSAGSQPDHDHLPEIAHHLTQLGITPPKLNVYGWLRNRGADQLKAKGVRLLSFTKDNAPEMLVSALRVHNHCRATPE